MKNSYFGTSMKEYHFRNELVNIPFEKNYPPNEAKIIQNGFLAPIMDDKWDIIYNNDALSFYRSWTGIGVFQLQFEENNDSLRVIGALADEEFLNHHSPVHCSTFINWLVDFIMLQKKADSPTWDYTKPKNS
ncbi:MAG: hypothetical protein ACFHU9_15230 [Fluviicola sp.]